MDHNQSSFLPKKSKIEFFKAGDGKRLRGAYFPSIGDVKASIVLIHGHREFLEKYTEFIEAFQNRGFNVYSFDLRGQGLSERNLENHSKSHTPDFDRLVFDIEDFINKQVKPDTLGHPLYMVAHSMGAHLGLRYLHDHPEMFDKAVLLSPFTDLNIGSTFFTGLAKAFFKMANIFGLSENFALGQDKHKDMVDHPYAISRLTHDEKRYYKSQDAIAQNQNLFIGGVTYGWLNGAIDSIQVLHQDYYMEKIKTPILCLMAGEDKVVDNDVTIELINKTANSLIVSITGARHEIYRETDDVQKILWQKIDAFI